MLRGGENAEEGCKRVIEQHNSEGGQHEIVLILDNMEQVSLKQGSWYYLLVIAPLAWPLSFYKALSGKKGCVLHACACACWKIVMREWFRVP